MIEEVFFWASYGSFGGGAIGSLFAQWEQAGVFAYLLPFLLIFALIFGVLSQMHLFKENRAINGVISLAVGLMAIQFDIVPLFFAEIFPRMGAALAVLLVAMILLGLFVPSKAGPWILFTVGAVSFVVILIQTAGSLGWASGYWWQDNWLNFLGIAILLALVIIIITSSGKDKPSEPNDSILSKLIKS